MNIRRVLIISNPEDEHTTRVCERIRQFDAIPILLYPEQFGRTSSLVLEQGLHDCLFTNTVMIGREKIDLGEIYSIWYRRPRLVRLDEDAIAVEELEFARDEWKAALEAMYAMSTQVLWVSHPDRLREAARKPVQAQLACQLGLKAPRTLITNHPDKVREFYDICRGRVVVKATGRGWVYSQDSADLYYVLTNRATLDDIHASDEISIAPVTFQEEISKEYEVRANVVGQQVFAVRIDSQRSEISSVDWRRYDVLNTPYTAYKLPAEIERKCLHLTQLLGLEFGAIDLIREPKDEYVFLEINGNGQFLWAEDLSGVEVSTALAGLLAGESPPLTQVTFNSLKGERHCEG